MTDHPPDHSPRSHGRLTISASAAPRDLMDGQRVKGAWTAKVITLFPEAFPGTLGLSLTGKALQAGLWALETVDLRTFGEGRHRNVDDSPAGGGAGMVLRADVVARALDQAALGTPGREHWPVVYLSPRGSGSIRRWRGTGRRGRASPCCAAASRGWISACLTNTVLRKSALAILS